MTREWPPNTSIMHDIEKEVRPHERPEPPNGFKGDPSRVDRHTSGYGRTPPPPDGDARVMTFRDIYETLDVTSKLIYDIHESITQLHTRLIWHDMADGVPSRPEPEPRTAIETVLLKQAEQHALLSRIHFKAQDLLKVL